VFETRFFPVHVLFFFRNTRGNGSFCRFAEPAKDAATDDLMPMGYAHAAAYEDFASRMLSSAISSQYSGYGGLAVHNLRRLPAPGG
jgi:hypothetical protein